MLYVAVYLRSTDSSDAAFWKRFMTMPENKYLHQYFQKDVKRVYYLSLEYLMGRLLGNSLINMDFYEECHNILKEDGYSLEEIREIEHDMGLGNARKENIEIVGEDIEGVNFNF